MKAWVVWTPIPHDPADPPPFRVRQQSEYARAALRECARRCGAPPNEWRQDAENAPIPTSGWFWSISHKPKMAVAAIARAPIGVDVEALLPRRMELYDQVGSEEEWRILGGRSWENFFVLWTAKESVMKANGHGIGYLSRCRVVARTPASVQIDFQGAPWRVLHRNVDDHIIGLAGDFTCCDWSPSPDS